MGDRPPHPPLSARHRGFRILLGFGVIALAVLVAGYFFGRRPLGEFFAGKLGERLAEDGVFIDWKSADWAPGEGVRLRGLALYRDAARRDRLALLGLVTARRPDPSFLRWDKMNFKAADTQLLLGRGANETRLEHMDLLLLIQPGKTDLPVCYASLQGLRIEFQCALANAPPTGTAEAIAAARLATQREGLFRDVNLDWLKSAKEWLRFQSETDEPVLKMNLHALGDRGGQGLTMAFDGERFQWRGLKWDFAQAAVTIPIGVKNTPIDIEHVRIGYAGRSAEIAGAFDSTSRIIRITKFDSGIDLLAFARAYNPNAVKGSSAVSTSGFWRTSGAGEVAVDHPQDFHWRGNMALEGELAYASGGTTVALQKPAFAVRVDGQVATISDLKASLWGGNLTASKIQIDPSKEEKRRIEMQLTLSGMRPRSILNSFSTSRNPVGAIPWDWKGAWKICGTAEVPADHPEKFRWLGDVALDGEFVYVSGEKKVALQKPAFALRWEEQAAAISDLKAGLWDGNLNAAKIQFDRSSKEKNLRVETQFTLSSARPESILKSFGASWKSAGVIPWDWKGAWRFSGAAEIPTAHPENLRVHGDVVLDGEFFYAGVQTNVALQKPIFSVRLEDQRVAISDLKAGLWGGSLDAPKIQIHLPSKERKLGIETQLTLSDVRLQSILKSFGASRKSAGVIPWDWKGAWQIRGAVEIPLDHPEDLRGHGDATLDGGLVYTSSQTKVALQKPAFSMQLEDQVVAISDFKAGLWEGNLNARKTLIYLPSTNRKLRFETQLALDGARSQSVRESFTAGQKQPRAIRLSWKNAWQMSAAGEIPMDHPENFSWHGDVALNGDLVYASGETNVSLQKPTFSVQAKKQVVAISDFKAGLWGGSLDAPKTLIYLPPGKKNRRFVTQIRLSDVRLQSIVHSFGSTLTEPGVVQGNWKGGGEFDPATFSGSGSLSIGDAEFGRMPIVGPLYLVLKILAPGLQKDEPSTLTVNHRIAGNALYLEELKLVSAQALLGAKGVIDLTDESTQLTARGRLRRLPGIVTVLLTSLLEFKGEGPVDDVHWRLKSLPGFHWFDRAAKTSPKTDAEKANDEALKGLLELPGNLLQDE